MKRLLWGALASVFIVGTSSFVQAKPAEDQSQYLQKILIVVDSPETGVRLRDENALKIQAHLYTPRVDTVVSSPVMPSLKTLSNEKNLAALAAEQKADGVLVITDLTTTTRDEVVCPRSSSGDIIVQIVDTLTTKCPTVHIPKVSCTARLYRVSPYEEVWHLDAAAETNAREQKSPEKLFNDLAIKIFKDIQRHKLILPSKFQR